MKKALVLFLALAVAGAGFAQTGVTWGGEITSGIFGQGGEGEKAQMGVDNDDGSAVKAAVNLDVDKGDYGLQLAIESDTKVGNKSGANFNTYNAHGWLTIMDMITFRAGIVDPSAWSVGGWVDRNYSSGRGVRMEVTPIEGLNVGFILTDNRLWNDSVLFSADPQHFVGSSGAGFKYRSGDIKVDGTVGLYSERYTGDGVGVNFAIGGGYDGIDNLTTYLGFGLETVDPENSGKSLLSDDPRMRIGLNLDYDVMPELKVGFEFGATINSVARYGKTTQTIFGQEVTTGTDDYGKGLVALFAKPSAEYAVTPELKAGLGVGVNLKSFVETDRKNGAPMVEMDVTTTPPTYTINAHVSTVKLGLASIEPEVWLEYKVGGNAYIKGIYKATVSMLDEVNGVPVKNTNVKNTTYTETETTLWHKVGVLFGFSF